VNCLQAGSILPGVNGSISRSEIIYSFPGVPQKGLRAEG
jgi:hypothetical protein